MAGRWLHPHPRHLGEGLGGPQRRLRANPNFETSGAHQTPGPIEPVVGQAMNQLSIGNCPAVQRVAKSWKPQDWNRARERAHRAYARKVKDIADAAATGLRVNRFIRNFLGDPEVRLSAALRALGGHPGPHEAFALRDQINCWATDYPPVSWYPKRKSSGGFRPICRLPPTLKATHYMVAAIIGAQRGEAETLFGIPGRGIANAMVGLKALQNRGFVHLARTDIVNCFQSIDPDSLYQLPLPTEVIRQTLDYRTLKFTRDHHQFASPAQSGGISLVRDQYHNASGPTGLLQGSFWRGYLRAYPRQKMPGSWFVLTTSLLRPEPPTKAGR